MERADPCALAPGRLAGHAEGDQPVTDLARSLACEGRCKDLGWIYVMDHDEVSDPLDERASLAGSGASDDHGRAVDVLDDDLLVIVQAL
jgi:hypothetical protein